MGNLNLLSEMGEVLAGKDGFNAVMIRAFRVLAREYGLLRGGVLLQKGELKQLEMAVAYRLPPKARHLQQWLHQFRAENILDEAIQLRQGILRVAESTNAETSWFFCQPIVTEEKKVTGVLSLELASVLPPDEKNTREVFRVIGSMVAQALIVNQLVEDATQRILNEDENLRAELSERYDFSHIIGNSGRMRQVYEQLAQISCTNTTVLISGETGTGKELVAQALHINSPRAAKPFIKVNCGVLVESLVEAELFGYERGAFTGANERKAGRFELAEGGTLLLDEIGELSLSVQAKLLRVLQTREFERVGGTQVLKADVRIIAATNRNLEQEIKAGRFRADLYYRLNIFPIIIPALRERRDDIPTLAEHFLQKCLRLRAGEARRISTPAMELLIGYDWPGNVRELQNTIERAVVIADGQLIQHYHLPPAIQTAQPIKNHISGNLFAAVERYEQELLCDALREARGNRNQAAKALGISERVLSYKVKKYEIDCTQFK
ncbi:MAG: sigma-54-dependent Fis family transcriptional regulator [Blastocatellia bacterium]|nr:sigma-54-dependent Fis family transcriptional regulator [Blastocatellia bacterium]